MKKNILASCLILGTALLGAVLFFAVAQLSISDKNHDNKVTTSSGSSSNSQDAINDGALVKDKKFGTKTHFVSKHDQYGQAIDLLVSTAPDRWLEAQKNYFNSMNASQLWNLLTSPGVSDQSEAKFFRHEIVHWCGAPLDAIQNGNPEVGNDSLVYDFCRKLDSVGDLSYFISQGQALDNDSDFLNKYNYTTDPRDSTSAQKADMDESLKTLLSQTRDPWQTSAIIDALWNNQSDAISNNWTELDALLPSQRALMRRALETAVACSMIGGCSASNPWTVGYCAEPTIVCSSGVDVGSAIANNMPPSQLQMYNAMLQRVLAQMLNSETKN